MSFTSHTSGAYNKANAALIALLAVAADCMPPPLQVAFSKLKCGGTSDRFSLYLDGVSVLVAIAGADLATCRSQSLWVLHVGFRQSTPMPQETETGALTETSFRENRQQLPVETKPVAQETEIGASRKIALPAEPPLTQAYYKTHYTESVHATRSLMMPKTSEAGPAVSNGFHELAGHCHHELRVSNQ